MTSHFPCFLNLLRSYLYSELGTCLVCPRGTICDTDGGSTQEKLIVAKGFWRIHSMSTEIYPCPLPEACIGGENFTSSANYFYNAVGYCKAGYYGPMCGVCANDNTGPNDDYYFNPDTQTCDACFDLEDPFQVLIQSPTLIAFVCIMIVVAVLILRFIFCTNAADLDSKVIHYFCVFECKTIV